MVIRHPASDLAQLFQRLRGTAGPIVCAAIYQGTVVINVFNMITFPNLHVAVGA